MSTINQLVKKGRGNKTRKSKSPVLNVGFNAIERKTTVEPEEYEPALELSAGFDDEEGEEDKDILNEEKPFLNN